MRTRSTLWRTLAESGEAKLEAKAIINGVEYPEILNPAVNRALCPDALSVGNCVSATLQFSIRPDAGTPLPESAAVLLKIRFTDGVRKSEWMEIGTFYANRRTEDPVTGTVVFQGFDAMRSADAPFPSLSGFPKPMNSVVMEIAHNLGVEVDERTWNAFPTGGDLYVPLPASGEKMIKVLGYIGGVCGGNWIITPRNRLRFVPLLSASDTTETADPANIIGIIGGLSTGKTVTVTGIAAESGSKTYLAGDETGAVIRIRSNPYVTQNFADALLEKYRGLVYCPYAIQKALYDPAAEAGDFLISRADVRSVLYQESAYYGPAFRGDVSAPFLSETSGSEQSLSDAISAAGDTTGDLSVRFYKFVSPSAVTVASGQSAEIINFDYAAGPGQDVIFHAEVKHTTETTETGNASTGWTCTDAVLTVTYYINGAEVRAYHPAKTETDGANLLHLNYQWENGKYTTGNFRAVLTLSGGGVTVAAGDARAYIIGQGYVGGTDGDWVTEDGLVFIGTESYPEKLNYATGETLDLTGLVVKAYYANGIEEDITADCAVTPADGAELEPGETVVEVSYQDGGKEFTDSFSVYCEANVVLFIEVTTPPTTTMYFPGEELDLTGVVVTTFYEDGTEKDVTAECVFTPADGTTLTGNQTIYVNADYTENGETFTTYLEVNVKTVRITSYPVKSDYVVGEPLDFTGLVVEETLSNGTAYDITSECVISPADGTSIFSAGDIMVDVQYNGKSLGTFWVAAQYHDHEGVIFLKANPDIAGLTEFPMTSPDKLSSNMIRDFEIAKRNSIQYAYWQYIESSEERSGNGRVSYSKDVRLAFYPSDSDGLGWIVNVVDGSGCQEAWTYENSAGFCSLHITTYSDFGNPHRGPGGTWSNTTVEILPYTFPTRQEALAALGKQASALKSIANYRGEAETKQDSLSARNVVSDNSDTMWDGAPETHITDLPL